MQDTPGRATRLLLLPLASLLLACGLNTEERLNRGQQSLQDGEFRAAAIDARSVLQSEPENVDGRLLLGRAALELGDLGSAEKELNRAIELGTPKTEVAADLGRLLLAQQRYRQLLDEITPELGADAAAQATLLRLRAEAQLELGDPTAARDIYRQVLAVDDRDPEAMLGIVSTYMAEERYEQARATLDEVRAIDADYIPVWLTSGKMHLGMRNARRAEADFDKAAELAAAQSSPRREAEALRGLVEARFARNDADGAEAALARLTELAPDDVRTHFQQARLAYIKRDWDTAQEHLQTVLRVQEEFRPAQMLLGAVHLSRGNLGQAEMYLSAVVAAEPDNADARRLLAETRLRQNKADDATSVLEPLLAEGNTDARSLGIAARASLAAGDFAAATGLLQRQIEQEPGNTSLALDLAAAHLAAGEIEAAEAILSKDGDTSEADNYRREMLTVLSRVKSGDVEAATAAARAMTEQYPDDARPHNLLGGIYLAAEDRAAAAEQFTAALDIAPEDRTALFNLGRIEGAGRNFEAARGYFSRVLEVSPGDAAAMQALGMIAAAEGQRDTSVEWLEKARAAGDSDVRARVLLARRYIAEEDFERAETVAEEAVAIDAQSAEAHSVLGGAQEGRGDNQRALASYRRAAELEPGNRRYALNYARAQLNAGRQAEANSTLTAVEEQGADDDLRLSLQLAVLKANAGEIDAAIGIGERMRERFPDSEMPHLLLGELHFRSGDPQRGAAEFDRALDKVMSLRIAGRAYTLRRQYDMDDPVQPVARFLEQYPDNETARLAMAQHNQTMGNDAAAIADYEAILEQNPDNFTALNNLGWLYFTNGDERAEALARRAHEAAPESGAVADTLGWILVSKGALEEGVELLRRADELSGGRATIRYHLAVGLAESGATDEARALLEELLSGDTAFAERDQAELLLGNL